MRALADELAIGMIACERPQVDVHEAIAQLRQGGFEGLVHLFCEPGLATLRPMPRVIVHRNPVRRGVMGNWSWCLRWLLEHTSAEFLMVCEDDVAYCRGAYGAWAAGARCLTGVGYWSLYTPRRDKGLVGHQAGWVASNRGRDSWGTQAMVFPRQSAEIALAYPPLREEDQMRGPTDAIVAQCFVDAGLPCYYHNPSLADHLGRVSSVGHNWYDDHVGFDFDPEYLPERNATTDESDALVPQSRKPRTAVVTVYQDNIPREVISAQAEVICRFLPDGCEFEPLRVSHHALGLNDYFGERRHDAYVIFDIDCIPLTEWVIPWLLEQALAGIVVGPAQRANHLDNGAHVFAGPGALAFGRQTFERLGCPSFGATERGDVAEEITYACERLDVPICLLWPTDVITPKWALRHGLRLGNGTTFGGAVFHAFEISKGDTVDLFLTKCREVLAGPPRKTFIEPAPEPRAAVAPAVPPRAVFHEQWYAESELKLLGEAVAKTRELPGQIVEIGCWEGRSTAVIANGCFPERVVAIDSWEGCTAQGPDHETVRIARERDVFAIFEANMRALTNGNVSPLRGDAFEFLRQTTEPIKFCHIDASHDYPSVRETLELLLPRLTPGAVLFGHDYQSAHAGRDDLQGGVQRAVREVLRNHTSVGNTWSYVHGESNPQA